MTNIIFLFIFLSFSVLPLLGTALSGCGGNCQTLNDCSGQLICINGKCNDDPDVGTNICKAPRPPPPSPRRPPPPPSPRLPPPPPPSSTCSPNGSYNCNGQTGPTYSCSPAVTSSTSALLTLNDFSPGGDGGGPSSCDDQYHSNTEPIVALSTGWYAGGSRCGKMIRINANGRSVTAKVVDECDSMNGCDAEHAGQPPCRNNIVDGSAAVWNALGLDQDVGVVSCTWSMA